MKGKDPHILIPVDAEENLGFEIINRGTKYRLAGYT